MRTGRPPAVLDDALIVHLYADGHTESDIARILHTSRSSIHRRLLYNRIPIRSVYDANALRRHKTRDLSSVLDMLDGLVLSDAHIECDGRSEGRLEVTQRRACKPWLEHIRDELARVGVDATISDRGRRGYQLRTLKYVDFTDQYHRWYPDGTKVVPSDVILNATSIAHWYCGDGELESYGYRMTFCTDGFSIDEVRFLADRLMTLYAVHVRVFNHQPRQPRLCVERKADRILLADTIADHCVPCFAYKLAIKR